MKQRSISKTITAMKFRMGNSEIYQPLPNGSTERISPFILLHHWGPGHAPPGKALNVPPHPHRGFEPVTFLFEGEIEHEDSMGNFGHLKSGDVQWMTAGKGVVHSERTPKELLAKGGPVHGIQLWVNLPKKDKMTAPGYQDIKSTEIPIIEQPDKKSRIRVIAGEYEGKKGPASTFTPILALHVKLAAGAKITLPIPEHFNAFAYNTIGELRYNNLKDTKARTLVDFEKDGEGIQVEALANSEFLLLAGEPIDEPMVTHGPFVMNTQEELVEAIQDFQTGKF